MRIFRVLKEKEGCPVPPGTYALEQTAPWMLLSLLIVFRVAHLMQDSLFSGSMDNYNRQMGSKDSFTFAETTIKAGLTP
jgi:hypothetical protein